MFDIGFWEIALIAVVALLVVGPDEFPALVRNIGAWIGKIRRFMSDTKNDLDREFRKAEEIKQLMEREANMATLHEQVDARKIKADEDSIAKPVGGAAAKPPVIENTPTENPAVDTTPTQAKSSHGAQE